MKKKLLVLACSALLLTGCSFISFSGDIKPEGFEDPSQQPGNKTVEYFAGDEIVTEGHVSHVVSFIANDKNSQPVLSTSEAVLGVMNDADSFVTEATNIENVSQYHGLKIGHLNASINGSITFKLSADISAIEIKARPRASLVSSMEAMVEVIDQEVAINVNDSKYIKVKCDFEKMSDIVDSTLKYNITGEKKNEITINAIHERAEIMQITFIE